MSRLPLTAEDTRPTRIDRATVTVALPTRPPTAAVIVAFPGAPALKVVEDPERGESVPLVADHVGETAIGFP
jgi:hypothetical protein